MVSRKRGRNRRNGKRDLRRVGRTAGPGFVGRSVNAALVSARRRNASDRRREAQAQSCEGGTMGGRCRVPGDPRDHNAGTRSSVPRHRKAGEIGRAHAPRRCSTSRRNRGRGFDGIVDTGRHRRARVVGAIRDSDDSFESSKRFRRFASGLDIPAIPTCRGFSRGGAPEGFRRFQIVFERTGGEVWPSRN